MPDQKQPPQQHKLALPTPLSPDDVDPITELASILSRIQPPQSTVTLAGAVTGTTPGGGEASSQTTPLTLKDFPATADRVKHKLQRARTQIKALLDMDRSISEQEDEIRELEERLAKQQAVLLDLKEAGLEFAREQQQHPERMEE